MVTDPAILSSILRGGGRGQASFLQRDPRFQVGQNLSQFGSDTSATNLVGGLSRLISGGLGGLLASRAVESDRSNRAEANRYLSALLRGEQPDLGLDSDNPYLSELGQNYLQSTLQQRAEDARFQREAGLRAQERAEDRGFRQQQFEAESALRREQLAAQQRYQDAQLGLEERRLQASLQQPRSLTDAQERHQLAVSAGLQPGSPEYNDFLLRGKPRETDSSPFAGNTLEASSVRLLNDPNADPSSANYRFAFNYLTRPRYENIEGRIVQIPGIDPRTFRPPTGRPPGESQVVEAPPQEQSAPPAAPTPSAPASDFAGIPGARVVGYGPTNESQGKDADFALRMEASNEVIGRTQDAGSSLNARVRNALDRASGTSLFTTPEQQEFTQAGTQFVNAVLRRESGSAIHDPEFVKAYQTYIPSVGDSPELLEQKRRSRELITGNFRALAGTAYEKATRQQSGQNPRAPAPASEQPPAQSDQRAGRVLQYPRPAN